MPPPVRTAPILLLQLTDATRLRLVPARPLQTYGWYGESGMIVKRVLIGLSVKSATSFRSPGYSRKGRPQGLCYASFWDRSREIIKGGEKLYEIFRGEVAKVRKIEKLSNQDIADRAGLKKCTVAAFMCGARDSEATAKAIAKALKIEL